MKTLPIPFEIEGLAGALELREPTVKQVRPYMKLMADDSQAFMFEMIRLSLHLDGKHVKDAEDRIGISTLIQLVPLITELMGFGKEEKEKGNG